MGEEALGEGGGGCDDVLAVVEQQQEPAPCAVLGEPVEGVVPDPLGEGPQLLGGGAAQLGLAGAERGEGGFGDVLRVAGPVDGGEFDEPHPVGPGALVLGLGGLLGQPGLAGAAGSQQRDEAGSREVVADGADVVLAPDEGGQAGAQIARGHGGGGRGGGGGCGCGCDCGCGCGKRLGSRVRGGQQFAVQGAQLRARVRAQPVGQLPAYDVVRGQRLRRAARVAQGPDAQRVQRLVHRVLRAQRGQLRQGPLCLAQRQGRGQPAPARVRPYGLPARGLRARVRQVGEGRAAPQGEGLVVPGRRLGRVAGRAPGADQPLEAVQVDVLPRGGQLVAALRGPHGCVPERPPQPGDQRLQGGHRVGGRIRVPHLGDEQPGRHHPPRPQRERGQQRPKARSADGHGGPVVVVGLGGSEDRVTHRPIVPAAGPGPTPFSGAAAG